MGEKLPRDLEQDAWAASELNLNAAAKKLEDQGFELVDDAGLLEGVEITPADGVVEEPSASLSQELKNDKEYEYKVVMDTSGVSEVAEGKPKFKLLRKKK